MNITIDMLRERDACGYGLDAFKKIYPIEQYSAGVPAAKLYEDHKRTLRLPPEDLNEGYSNITLISYFEWLVLEIPMAFAPYMKHQIGDKVKIRSDLNFDDKYYMQDGLILNDYMYAYESMIACAGQEATIIDIFNHSYALFVCGDIGYHWHDEMFEEDVQC